MMRRPLTEAEKAAWHAEEEAFQERMRQLSSRSLFWPK